MKRIVVLCAMTAAAAVGCAQSAPADCDPKSDYVCRPDTKTQTTSVEVPTSSLSPTEVPVPSSTMSPTVTTTVVP